MAELNMDPISKKIEDMIKQELKAGGHIKSGKLYNSISVTYKNGTFQVSAEDYYTAIDEEYGISEAVFNSEELAVFIENYLSQELEKQI